MLHIQSCKFAIGPSIHTTWGIRSWHTLVTYLMSHCPATHTPTTETCTSKALKLLMQGSSEVSTECKGPKSQCQARTNKLFVISKKLHVQPLSYEFCSISKLPLCVINQWRYSWQLMRVRKITIFLFLLHVVQHIWHEICLMLWITWDLSHSHWVWVSIPIKKLCN